MIPAIVNPRMTDVPDQAELDTNREAAREALEKAHIIVDAMLLSLGDYDREYPGQATDELERASLVTVALMDSFKGQPGALVTIATAAIIKLDRLLREEHLGQPVTHLS